MPSIDQSKQFVPLNIAVLTMSDTRSLADDKSGSTLADRLTAAEGQALRALRVWLFECDHLRGFGGLRRAEGPSGDLLWVCQEHYPEYDPGLPTIP